MSSAACSACFLGFHGECFNRAGEACCCGGEADLDTFYGQEAFEHQLKRSLGASEDGGGGGPKQRASGLAAVIDTADRIIGTGKIRGNSGYIAPEAWPSTFDIGELRSVLSAGHKRPRKMYPIKPGQVCDWAGMRNCGGGPVPVLGCVNNPATEWHHGPDKNTLNNERSSVGIGNSQNVHVICSECHNLYHAMNDGYYPDDYDRDRDQARPWIPRPTDPPWRGHEPEPADLDELLEQERQRAQQRIDRGRERRGRTLKGDEPDFSLDDDDEGDDDDEQP